MNDCVGCAGQGGLTQCICGGSGHAKDAVTYLQKRLVRAEEALEFYGDPESYFAIAFIPDPPCGEFISDFSDCGPQLGNKPGRRAREALTTPVPE